MNSGSLGEQALQKNIYGLIFLLYSVTYIANHATAIFSLKGAPKEILHYSGEVVLILCAVGYEAFGMMSKGREGNRWLGFVYRFPILFWIGCGAVFLNAVLLILAVFTGRCEK